MLFSVIIPIYNGYKTIEKSINSVLKQYSEDIEIIVVNDGSNDFTPNLLQKIKNDFKGSNFILINQENSGVAAARINGIRSATGRYICFLDADDELPSGYFDKLKEKIIEFNDPDLINFNYCYSNGTNRILFDHTELIEDKNIVAERFFGSSLNNSCWNKCYKRNVIGTCDFSITVGIKSGEDRLFNECVFLKIRRILFLNEILYVYQCETYFGKHSEKKVELTNKTSITLYNNVIKLINNKAIIDKIRNHELDKILTQLRNLVKFRKFSFKAYKSLINEFRDSLFYNLFLCKGFSKGYICDRMSKKIYKLICKKHDFCSFIFLKILSFR